MGYHLPVYRNRNQFQLGHCALLLIDVQNFFFDISSAGYLPDTEKAFPVIIRLAKVFKEKKLPVIGTVHKNDHPQMKKWWGNQIASDWAKPMIKCDHIITKTTYDAFYQTELNDILQELRVTQVIIAGVRTSLCCETSVRSAFVRDYDVALIENACCDRNKALHAYSLLNLANGFATIVSADEVLCKLQ